MRFLLDREQRAFAASLDTMLTAADTPSVVRDWSRGEFASGRALWSRIAAAGVFALAVPESYEGLGPRPVELAVAFVELGRHAVPGPLVETVAAARLPGDDDTAAKRLLPSLASGDTMATLTPPSPHGAPHSYALDGEAATSILALSPDGALRLAPVTARSTAPSTRPAVSPAPPPAANCSPPTRMWPRPSPGPASPRPRRRSASASRSSTGPWRTSGSAPSSGSP